MSSSKALSLLKDLLQQISLPSGGACYGAFLEAGLSCTVPIGSAIIVLNALLPTAHHLNTRQSGY
jgi:hypothetical protein